MIVDAYHGTTLKAARAIDTDPSIFEIRRTQRSKWMGVGIYFFQDGLQHAKLWAEACSARRGGDRPMVARATIDLTNGLDLVDGRYWSLFRRFLQTCPRCTDSQLGPEALFRPLGAHDADRLYHNVEDDFYITRFLEALNKRGINVPALRCAFIEGRPLHPSSWFLDQSHVQICIKDAAIIQSLQWIDPQSI